MKWSDDYTDLGVIEGILRKRLYPMSDLEYFEDGIQQGLFRAWTDQQKGGFTAMHVINRAETWARAFYMKPWLPLGHTRVAGIGGFNEASTVKVPIQKLDNPDPNKDWGVKDSKQLSKAVMVEEEEDIVNRLWVEDILSKVRLKYATALRLRFMEGYTLEEVGQVFSPTSKWQKKAGTVLINRSLAEAKQVVGVT